MEINEIISAIFLIAVLIFVLPGFLFQIRKLNYSLKIYLFGL